MGHTFPTSLSMSGKAVLASELEAFWISFPDFRVVVRNVTMGVHSATAWYAVLCTCCCQVLLSLSYEHAELSTGFAALGKPEPAGAHF